VKEWKSGFYHIARQAQVPILLAAIDAENKTLRMLGEFKPGDDLDSDMQSIQAAYKGLKGIRPENT
jgi:1-acyl-sn-glycerol-3-phosphate acyltransferase